MSLVTPGNDPVMIAQLLDMASRLGKMAIDTAVKSGAFPIGKSGVVAGGNLVVHYTDDGLSTGVAMFPLGNVYLDTLMLRADNEADLPITYGLPVLSNSNKTLTIPVKKATSVSSLPLIGALVGALLGAPTSAAANGSVIKAIVFGN